jgi:hypothetical protein
LLRSWAGDRDQVRGRRRLVGCADRGVSAARKAPKTGSGYPKNSAQVRKNL